jgi:predicted double-glycine peptidase
MHSPRETLRLLASWQFCSVSGALAWVRDGIKFPYKCLLLGAIAAGLLGILPASADSSGPVRSLLEMRQQGVVVQKFDLSCGAAAVATLLNFQFGDHVTEKEVTAGLIRRKEYIEQPELVRLREGFSLLDMKRYVTARGYTGIGYGKLELSDVLDLAPIIVAVSPLGYNHFVVFRGMIGDEVLLADPAFGNRTMSREKFERIWIDFPEIGKVGFIVTRNEMPAPPGLLAPQARQVIAPPGDLVRQVLRF